MCKYTYICKHCIVQVTHKKGIFTNIQSMNVSLTKIVTIIIKVNLRHFMLTVSCMILILPYKTLLINTIFI